MLLASAMFCQSAFAAPGDTFQPYVSYTYFQDDNLLRLPDAQTTTPDTADTYSRTEVGISIDKSISRQRFTADLSANRTAYDQFSGLDNDGRNLRANWAWQIGNHLEGNLGASYIKDLTPFDESRLIEGSPRQQRREFFNAAWRFHPSWRLRGGVTQYQLEYESAAQRFGNRTDDTSELGFDYLAPSGSTAGVILRNTKGGSTTPRQLGPLVIDNSYNQDEYKANIDWRISGKSRLQVLAGWVERTNTSILVDDYSGANARVIANWLPTGKVGVTLTGWREINPTDTTAVGYTLNKGVSLASNWDVLTKVRIDGLIKTEKRDYSSSVISNTLVSANRVDTTRYASLTLTYSLSQNLQISASAFRDDRDSTAPFNDYRAKGMMLSLRSVF